MRGDRQIRNKNKNMYILTNVEPLESIHEVVLEGVYHFHRDMVDPLKNYLMDRLMGLHIGW